MAANLLSIGAIDFGIIIDGTMVMVENIYRELGRREGQQYNLEEVMLAAAKDVDRPIFYSVAVIIAGYLPIYALTRALGKAVPSDGGHDVVRAGRRADLTLTFVPVMCAYWFKTRRAREREQALRVGREHYAGRLDWCLDHPKITFCSSRW